VTEEIKVKRIALKKDKIAQQAQRRPITRRDTMKRQTIFLSAVAGALLLAASQVEAQVTPYSDQDLLLNFRDISSTTPPDLTVDVANISTFLSSVPAGTTTELVSSTTLSSALAGAGAGDQIGFSAGAGTGTAFTGALKDTLWLTQVISGPDSTGSDLTGPIKQISTVQAKVDSYLGYIGAGYNLGSQVGSLNAATVASGNGDSYYSQTVAGGAMNYQTIESINEPLEGVQPASPAGNVYEALWEVQPSTKGIVGGPPDTYEGYFTFQTDGEVDYTSAVPEPSTYVLLALGGMFTLAFRRQLRSLIA